MLGEREDKMGNRPQELNDSCIKNKKLMKNSKPLFIRKVKQIPTHKPKQILQVKRHLH